MLRISFVFVIAFNISAQCATQPAFKCGDLEMARLRLSLHGSNLANLITTRTPEGTPYQKKSLKIAADGKFEVVSEAFYKMVHEPGHPDADPSGNVKYPNIDKASELAAFHMTAQELIAMGRSTLCGSSILETHESVIIKYTDPKKILSDSFLFEKKTQVISWLRRLKDGTFSVLEVSKIGSVTQPTS